MNHDPIVHVVYIISLTAIENLDILIRARNLCLGRGFHGIRERLCHTVVRDGDGLVPPGSRLLHRGSGICQGIHITHGGMQMELHPLFSGGDILAFWHRAWLNGIGPENHFVFKAVLRQLSLNPQNRTHLNMLQNGFCLLGLHKPADTNGAGVVRHIELYHPGVALGQLLVIYGKYFALYDDRSHIHGQFLHRNRCPTERLSVDGFRVLGLGLVLLRFRWSLRGQADHHPVPHGVQGIIKRLPLQGRTRLHLNGHLHAETGKEALLHLGNQFFQGLLSVGRKLNGKTRPLPVPPGTGKRPPGHGVETDKISHQFLRLTFRKLCGRMGHCEFHFRKSVSGGKLPGCTVQKPLGNIALGMGKHVDAAFFGVQIRTVNRRLRKSQLQLLRRRIIRKHIQN